MLNLSAPTWELEQDITLNSYIGWVGWLAVLSHLPELGTGTGYHSQQLYWVGGWSVLSHLPGLGTGTG